jgi:WhiB family redox-sensing transcriptional regulator
MRHSICCASSNAFYGKQMTGVNPHKSWSEDVNVFENRRPRWQDSSNCKDVGTDIFFHERYSHAVKEAKALCEVCKVKEECLEFAIEMDAVGIWGGMTTVERRRHIRHQGRQKYNEQKQKQRYARRTRSSKVVEDERPS